MKKDNETNKEHESCVFYCYKNYCNRNYAREKKAFGWASVIEYKCKGKCYLYRKNNWFNRLIKWLFF